jgi:lysozyme
VDVSNYQGSSINWASVKNSGKTFAFAKATEGLTYTDADFAKNWAGMKAARLIRGAYHYGHPGESAVDQANFFVNTVKPTAGDLQMMLDLETTDSQTPAQVEAWTAAFINQIKARTGRPGIIYCGYYFWTDSAGNGPNLNCPFFLAAYTSSTSGLIPTAWSTWSLWQYSDSGTVAGISGDVDLDCWNGTVAELNNLRLP